MRVSFKKYASAVLSVVLLSTSATAAPKDLNPQLAAYVKARAGEFGQIPAERKQLLDNLALYVHSQIAEKHSAKLLFICTHNSRRSHIAQIWAQTAALYYGVGPVETFSGGTEATAFNPRAVAALQRAGFEIAPTSAGSNPRYQVQYSSSAEPITAFSKTYDSAENPQVDFAAVMTCANADRLCPVVRGASLRVATLYDDPKSADGTPRESQTYDECSSGSVANSFTCSRG